MRTIYRFTYLLLCFVLVACASSSPAVYTSTARSTAAQIATINAAAESSMVMTEQIILDDIPLLTQVGALGYGYPIAVAWSPDGNTLAVGTSAGVGQYDTQNWLLSPEV
jgi:hypothetical protein